MSNLESLILRILINVYWPQTRIGLFFLYFIDCFAKKKKKKKKYNNNNIDIYAYANEIYIFFFFFFFFFL